MAGHQQPQSHELGDIKRDAVIHEGSGDHQVANRLQLEVSDYLKQHHTAKDVSALTSTLKTAGMQAQEIAELERLGFPSASFAPQAVGNDAGGTASSPNGSPASGTEGGNEKQATGKQPTEKTPQAQSLQDVLHEIHSTEDRYLFTDSANPQTQQAMHQALADVQNFCKTHSKDEARQLISQLESKDLLGQLSVTALQESFHKTGANSMSQAEALQQFEGQGDLGKAMQHHLQSAFAVTPDSTHAGTGYANAYRTANGQISGWDTPGSERVITANHADELLVRFSHTLPYKPENAAS